MKILFTLVVLIAGVYLILPKDNLKKLALFLPQNQIEQAAESVLSDVDQKLEQFKIQHLMNKDSRISQLEKQLSTLQAQVVAQEEKYKLADIEQRAQALQLLSVDKSSAEKLLAKNQNVSAEPLSIQPKSTQPKQSVANNIDSSIKETDKQRAIKRQAYLQDLVARMNKTSLLTLTH